MAFAVPVDHRVKIKENEKRDKYEDLARGQKKKNNKQTIEHEGAGDINRGWCTWDNPQMFV